jgi:hypothetical protein
MKDAHQKMSERASTFNLTKEWAWFQYQWPTELKEQHITVKELLPIVITIAIWGADWANRSILCHCDNEAVVHILNSGMSKDPLVMGLMRCLHFITAKFNLLLSATRSI